MKWKKLGCIYDVQQESALKQSYARIPIADYHKDNEFYIYFGSRDHTGRERVFRILYDIEKLCVVKIFPDPVLDFVEDVGLHDDNGVTPCCILNKDSEKLLYFCGWNIHVKIPFTCAIGLAKYNAQEEKFERLFKGPILTKNKYDAQFVAVNDVMYDENIYKTWYLSCIEWKKQDDGSLLHYYNIKYAESEDGIDWKVNNGCAIPFKNEYEYAISTPRVIKCAPNLYKMWYSYRASEHIATYRIGYAESTDGKEWDRKDHLAGIDVSEEGWDADMICYPFLFDHKGKRYMLYNGNGYGRTGFGLAVLEEE